MATAAAPISTWLCSPLAPPSPILAATARSLAQPSAAAAASSLEHPGPLSFRSEAPAPDPASAESAGGRRPLRPPPGPAQSFASLGDMGAAPRFLLPPPAVVPGPLPPPSALAARSLKGATPSLPSSSSSSYAPFQQQQTGVSLKQFAGGGQHVDSQWRPLFFGLAPCQQAHSISERSPQAAAARRHSTTPAAAATPPTARKETMTTTARTATTTKRGISVVAAEGEATTSISEGDLVRAAVRPVEWLLLDALRAACLHEAALSSAATGAQSPSPPLHQPLSTTTGPASARQDLSRGALPSSSSSSSPPLPEQLAAPPPPPSSQQRAQQPQPQSQSPSSSSSRKRKGVPDDVEYPGAGAAGRGGDSEGGASGGGGLRPPPGPGRPRPPKQAESALDLLASRLAAKSSSHHQKAASHRHRHGGRDSSAHQDKGLKKRRRQDDK